MINIATFYLPNSTGGYNTGNQYIKFRVVLVENYSTTNGKRMMAKLYAYKTSNSTSATNAKGSCRVTIAGTNSVSNTWAMGGCVLKPGSGKWFNGSYVTLTNAATNVKVNAYFNLPSVSAGNSSKTGLTKNLTKYTVSFNANGGSGAPGNQTGCFYQTITLSSTKPTRTGYDFLGWSTSSTATSASYSAGGSYQIKSTSTVTLYAVWKMKGAVRIYTSNGWKQALPYIYTSNGWKQTIPYIYTSNGWKQCG